MHRGREGGREGPGLRNTGSETHDSEELFFWTLK